MARRNFPTFTTDPSIVSSKVFADYAAEAVNPLWDAVPLPLEVVSSTFLTYTCTLTPALIGGIKAGMSFWMPGATANTSSVMWITINGGSNITVEGSEGPLRAGEITAGKMYLLYYTGSKMLVMGAGKIADPGGASLMESVSYSANTDITTIIPQTNSVPLITDGTNILNISVIVTSITAKYLVMVDLLGQANAANLALVATLWRGNTCIGAFSQSSGNTGDPMTLSAHVVDVPGNAGPTGYAVRVGPEAAGTIRMNGTPSGRMFGGVAKCSLTAVRIAGT